MNIKIHHMQVKVKKGVFPYLNFEIYVSCDRSERKPNSQLLIATVKLTLQGDCIASSEPLLLCKNFDSPIELSANIPMPRDLIDAIESTRVDDLPLGIVIEMFVSSELEEGKSQFFRDNLHHNLKYSQKEWTGMLKEMGYSEAWIFEIARPTIEGMDVVVEHLQKAADNIATRDYEGCMANTRIAWNAVKPLLDSKWDEIKALIDEDSPGESNHDPKSTRIKATRDNIHSIANVGIHREAYKIQQDDAILCYYLTVSMVSYLSKLLKKAA
jgi:hypothetical protein